MDRVTGNGVERRKQSRDQKEMELAEPIPEFQSSWNSIGSMEEIRSEEEGRAEGGP